MSDKKRSKSGQRDHDDGNAGFHELPEYFPGNVDGVCWGMNSRYLNNGGDDHYDGQTERKAKGELLLKFDSYAPKKKNGNDND